MVSLGNASRGPAGSGVGDGGTVRSAVVGGTHLSPVGAILSLSAKFTPTPDRA